MPGISCPSSRRTVCLTLEDSHHHIPSRISPLSEWTLTSRHSPVIGVLSKIQCLELDTHILNAFWPAQTQADSVLYVCQCSLACHYLFQLFWECWLMWPIKTPRSFYVLLWFSLWFFLSRRSLFAFVLFKFSMLVLVEYSSLLRSTWVLVPFLRCLLHIFSQIQ